MSVLCTIGLQLHSLQYTPTLLTVYSTVVYIGTVYSKVLSIDNGTVHELYSTSVKYCTHSTVLSKSKLDLDPIYRTTFM